MVVELAPSQWKHVLEWCKANGDAESDESVRQFIAKNVKESNHYSNKANTWKELETKIKLGLKKRGEK